MAKASPEQLPTPDYVSIVASLYKDKRTVLVGLSATALAAALTAVRTGEWLLWAICLAFIALAIIRYMSMAAFQKNPPRPDDRASARAWETRQFVIGAVISLVYGAWCFVCIAVVGDDFAALTAVAVTIAAMIAIATRNFGVDRVVMVQVGGIAVPLALGLFSTGDIYHIGLAALLVPMMMGFRYLAAEIRDMLLAANHQRQSALRMADQRDTALETMQHGLCMLDENGVVALTNDQAEHVFAGANTAGWAGRKFSDLLEEAIADRALPQMTADRLNRMIATHNGGQIVMKLSGDNHFEVTVSSRGDRTVLLFDNVTARIKAQERINFMAHYDGLTGLANRAYFTEQVEADLAARQRVGEAAPVHLAIIDLDDFKHINDALGHVAGDKVLIETAMRIQTAMNRVSRLAHMGGDEFVVYRAHETSEKAALAEMEAIRSALSQPFEVAGERLDLHASIGYTLCAEGAVALDELVMRADLALHRAKAQGKNQLQMFLPEMDSAFRYRQKLRADLAEAIHSAQLGVAFQPIIDLSTRKLAGFEALARWTHPELGPIAPDVFIGLAEETGLISEVTRQVLAMATRECAGWPAPLSVAVNISGRDLRCGDELDRSVTAALANSGLAPERLEIEVTETALIEEREGAVRRLTALAASGIAIALDDFGTGYSSLSYLHEMPFKKLKIDRSFIADITTNERSLKLMANVARLGKDLDLVLTAEGVETQEQFDCIARNTGIDQAQGFLFGAPMPASDIPGLIAKSEIAETLSAARKLAARPVLVE